MKISIITLHAVKNYGSVLQALATQELFKQHGVEVEIINYIRPDVLREALGNTYSGGNIIKRIVMIPTIRRWDTVFDGFCQQYLNLTQKRYSYASDFNSFKCDADAYCTGSDQVWNSRWNHGIIKPLYLDFVPKSKYKFAFAASFGQEALSESEVFETKELIEQYAQISVREYSGVNILKEQYHFDKVTHLVDPTLCVSPDFWRSYANPIKIKGDYILIYNLNRSKEFDKYALELANRLGLRLVRLCTRYDQFYRPGQSVLVPMIGDFISLIDNAKYVLTDSFHATAFSMNMNTEPICVYPQAFMGRLADFLKLLGEEQRHVKNYNDFDVVNRKVDFEKVNDILSNERRKASLYIDNIIDEIKNWDNGEYKI